MNNNSTNRGRKLLKDFGIYTIGVIGNRLISVLILPFYTYFISNPADYGYYDLCLNVCLTLIPITTLQMRESAFRFLLNNHEEELMKKIVTFIVRTLLISLSVIIITSIVIYGLSDMRFFVLTVSMLISMTLYDVWTQMMRGLYGNNKYVACNIALSFLIFFFSVLFVAILKMGVEGIYLSMILSRVMVLIYGELKISVIGSYFKFNISVKDVAKDVLYYAMPLIPTTFFTSLIITCNRFFISTYVSTHANGIYAVAYRFTMVMGSFALVFYQTWQESAILQYHSKDRDAFFSKVFNFFLIVLTFVLISSSFLIKMNSWLIADEYMEAMKYLYLIGVAQFFSSISSSFFELGYQCSKETYREITSVVLALIVNLLLCYLVVPHYGVYGVVVSNIFAYAILVIYRYIDTRRYFKIDMYRLNYFILLIIPVGALLFSLNYGIVIDLISLIVLVILLLFITPKELKKDVLHSIRKK